jgi:hypothetical protein
MGSVERRKANVLLFGGGAVGTIAALNIETGGLGAVTAVLRSNFGLVKYEGYAIKSVDHGKLKGWRPTRGDIDSRGKGKVKKWILTDCNTQL